jgi:hypothetical protein
LGEDFGVASVLALALVLEWILGLEVVYTLEFFLHTHCVLLLVLAQVQALALELVWVPALVLVWVQVCILVWVLVLAPVLVLALVLVAVLFERHVLYVHPHFRPRLVHLHLHYLSKKKWLNLIEYFFLPHLFLLITSS